MTWRRGWGSPRSLGLRKSRQGGRKGAGWSNEGGGKGQAVEQRSNGEEQLSSSLDPQCRMEKESAQGGPTTWEEDTPPLLIRLTWAILFRETPWGIFAKWCFFSDYTPQLWLRPFALLWALLYFALRTDFALLWGLFLSCPSLKDFTFETAFVFVWTFVLWPVWVSMFGRLRGEPYSSVEGHLFNHCQEK